MADVVTQPFCRLQGIVFVWLFEANIHDPVRAMRNPGLRLAEPLLQCFMHSCLAAFRGWDVVVTGHSLGAGVAVLVALYLQNFPQTFPR